MNSTAFIFQSKLDAESLLHLLNGSTKNSRPAALVRPNNRQPKVIREFEQQIDVLLISPK